MMLQPSELSDENSQSDATPESIFGGENEPNSIYSDKPLLEALTEKLMQAWDGSLGPESEKFIRQYCTSDFEMVNTSATLHESPFPDTNTLDEHLAVLEALKRGNPAWRVNAFNFSAEIDKESWFAIVWFTSGKSGDPGEPHDWSTTRESVSKLFWRKRKGGGRWEAYRHHCIRGGAGFGDR